MSGRWRTWVRAVAMAAVWTALGASAAGAAGPSPIRIPLAPLGYQSIVQDFLVAGSSMLTVDFVDSDHLLITFGVRRLMRREVDPPPNDDDRVVEAVLVELPSGKVMARTEWRFHDRSQYLWNLGHGRFLLRVRDRLTVLAPMDAANRDDPFREAMFLRPDRHIVGIFVSPEGDLLTVETTRPPAGPGMAQDGMGGAYVPGDPAPVQIIFYRLMDSGEDGGKLHAVFAGAIRTKVPLALPLTTAGYLEIMDGGRGTWLFNFDEHAGKVDELLAFDTSCFPRSEFVSHTEFVVFGCRGSDDRQSLAGFNLKGDEMWQENFTDTHVAPTFSFAPAAGRFALGRLAVNGIVDPENVSPAAVNGQEVRVYQSYNGRLLFRGECSPAERAGQNFALSPGGLRLALVQESLVRHAATKDDDAYTERSAAVVVYPLPPLSAKEQAAVEEAEAVPQADAEARIDEALERLSAKEDKGTGTAAASVTPVAAKRNEATAPLGTETAADAGRAPGQDVGSAETPSTGTPAPAVEGDPDPTARREPPTLYGPGEKKPDTKKPE